MIVSNTTPLSNFLHLNRMDILQRLFTHIHIPQLVREELEEFFSTHEQLQKALQDGFLVVHTIQSSVILKQFLNVLHQGEAEALGLYIEQQAVLCLVDEKDARAFATMNGINISGTLGVLIQAKQRGIIDAVKPLMDTLRTQHYFWISEPMYQLVLRLSSEI
jgi:predicted nucleic acid-binding protein